MFSAGSADSEAALPMFQHYFSGLYLSSGTLHLQQGQEGLEVPALRGAGT